MAHVFKVSSVTGVPMAVGLVASHGEEHVTGISVQFLARKQEKMKRR